MKRLPVKVSPTLALALAVLWLLLNQSASVAEVLLGLGLGILLSGFTSALRPLRARLRRPDTALLLILVVIKDVVLSNIGVARLVLRRPRGRALRSTFISVPLDLRDPHGLAALAAIVTATPGTVWAGLSSSGDALTLHVLDLENEVELIGYIKNSYERPLMRIFE